MKLKALLFGIAALGLVAALSGCSMGVGGHHGHGHAHHGPPPGPADHYDVQFAPFETMREVKCPVCGGAGSIKKSYVCQPVPSH
jgi:hypothetical protein